MTANGTLQGLRVLVVEDEPLICLLFEDMLQDFGCEILGPACDLASASELAQLQAKIDVAILDVNLSGRPVFPVADILSRRGVPILFATGLGTNSLPQDWQGYCSIEKPITSDALAGALGRALENRV
jgi:CheY-like chemotaxis protein